MEFEVRMCSTQQKQSSLFSGQRRGIPLINGAQQPTQKELNKKQWNIATIQEMPYFPNISKAGGAFTKVQLEILSVRLSKLFKGCPPFDLIQHKLIGGFNSSEKISVIGYHHPNSKVDID